MSEKPSLAGVISAVVPPFTSDERLDEQIFRREVKYLLGTGIHGISPGGSTGDRQLNN
jgi:dihydrodipicolinate synthase/N-acetylneuraminate lyase